MYLAHVTDTHMSHFSQVQKTRQSLRKWAVDRIVVPLATIMFQDNKDWYLNGVRKESLATELGFLVRPLTLRFFELHLQKKNNRGSKSGKKLIIKIFFE